MYITTLSGENMLGCYHTDKELTDAMDKMIYLYKKRIAETEGKEESSYTVQERIREIVRYLDENMDHMVSRREAAKYVFLNEDYFSRMFKRVMELSPTEYRKEKRKT